MKEFYVNEEDRNENESTMLTAKDLVSDILEDWRLWFEGEKKILTVEDAVEAVEDYLDCDFFQYGELDKESIDALGYMFASEFEIVDEAEVPDFMIERICKESAE